MKMKVWWMGLLVLLSVGVFARGLTYALHTDDWNYFWLIAQPFRYPIVGWLHPGTLLQFYFLKPVLGYSAYPWLLLGILIKALAAMSVMILGESLIGSVSAGVIAGVLFAGMPLGFESVNWPSAYIVNIDVLCFAVAVSYWIRSQKSISALRPAIRWALAGFLLDPMRFLALVWVPFVVKGPLFQKKWKRPILGALVLAGVYIAFTFLPAFAQFYRPHWSSVPAVSLPDLVVRFLTMIGNTLLGWWLMLPFNPYEMAQSTRSLLAAGIGGLTVASLSAVMLYMKQGKQKTVLSTIGLWVLSTALVQWLSDPSYIAAPASRYMALPAVGICLLLAFIISRMPTKLGVIVTVLCLAVSVSVVQQMFGITDRYRNAAVVEKNIRLLDAMLGKSQRSPVIYLENTENTLVGPDDYRAQMMHVWTLRGDNRMPTFIMSFPRAKDRVCEETGFGPRDPFKEMFAVHVSKNGEMNDSTTQFRSRALGDPDIVEFCRLHGFPI